MNGTFVVGSDTADLIGWTPETLTAALRDRLAPLKIEVLCTPRESGVGCGLFLDVDDAEIRDRAAWIIERVIQGGI